MILQVKNVLKEFQLKSSGEVRNLKILDKLDLEMKQGESIAVLGKSGSGKSTFLSLVAGLDQPTAGEIWINSVNIASLSEKELADFRARKLAMVFQQFHLLPHLTALENVTLPLELTQELSSSEEMEQAAEEALAVVQLSERAHHFPRELSGGEQQRVAIARALVLKPDLLLADEPTGNLDSETNEEVTEQFFKIIKEYNLSLVLVTHDRNIAERCDRRYVLQNGRLELQND